MPTADKFEWPQGTPLFETLWRTVSESLVGNGIVGAGDFEVTATTTALQVAVASGEMFYAGTEYALSSASNLDVTPGDGTHDRWDTVYFDTATTTAAIRDGTPAPEPDAPDIQGDEILLAIIYVPQDATDIPDTSIYNWRAESAFPAEATQIQFDDSTGVYGVSNVDAALDELQEAAQLAAYPLANTALANSSLTVTAGTGLANGGSVPLGGTTTLDIAAGGVSRTELNPSSLGGLGLPNHHIQYAGGLASEEVSRFTLPAGEALEVYGLDLELKGGGTDTAVSIDLYDSTAGTVVASTTAGTRASGTPIGTSGSGATMLTRITTGSAGPYTVTASGDITIT